MVIVTPILLGLLACIPPTISAAATGPRPSKPRPRTWIPPDPLPQCAPADELKWQPVLDYDKDGCYNVAAIGPDGRISDGLPLNHHYSGHCRDELDSK